jgi:decaprenyl-phosphate phosphoribosyltransferase
MRWKQWIKNALIFAPWFASGRADFTTIPTLVLGFVAFSLLSSSIYIFNDLHDINEDRRHPDKSHRPIAVGLVTAQRAWAYGLLSLLVAFTIAALSLPVTSITFMMIYLTTSTLYIFVARNLFLIDIFFVAAGFVIRVLFGGSVSKTFVSPWLLVVIGFFSLFIIAGKRYSELESGNSKLSGRKSLHHYSIEYLKALLVTSLSATLMSYALWTIEGVANNSTAILSMVPFTFILFHYLSAIQLGKAEAPEQVLFKDPVLILAILMWAGIFYSRFL